ncbi:microspherule protein 1 [Vigna unguiculata]|uniref:Microspherule protein 1 n=1 Tax=Vigna unguiculata TaxID=3917 RepID=A0A4D6KWE4_VIGUN|nr:microspherule protein 1 [Vigna unguiculata]
MDPVEVHPPWVPEDDLLLKNAVEAGASLESLARGAVRFSRRYSFRELQDRWLSLLYDGDVSTKAALAMRNLELAKSAAAGGEGSGGGGGGEKRKFQSSAGVGKKMKFQSVRKQYCSMQKKLRRHRSGVMSSEVKNGVGCEGKENVVVDGNLNSDVVNSSVVGYGNCLGSEGVEVGQLGDLVSDVPLWKTIEDVSLPDLPVHVSVEGKSCVSEGGVDLKDECGNGGLKLNAPDAKSLSNLANEDELLFMNVEGKEVMAMDKNKDKPRYDNVDSLLLSSSADVPVLQKLDVEAKLSVPGGCVSDGQGIAANPLGASCGDQHFVSDPRNNAALSAVAQSPHSEHSEGFMICVLNTEHPDIPCNVNLDVSVVIPELAPLKSQPVVKEAGFSESAISNQRRNGPDGSLKKEAVLSQSFASKNSSYKPVVFGLKSENPGRNAITAVSRQSNNVDVNSSHGRSVRATVMPALEGHLKQEDIDAPAAAHVKAEEHKALSKSEAKSLSLDQEGGDIEDDGEDDYDDYYGDELPYFSDVETMILEMDLSPMDEDPNARREVLRYQHEDSRKTIMRLEQGAQSSMGRAIRSHGALAVVYGRILKEYIRKSKVVLGRATNDVHVDIDLGKEGEEVATKISRRQALIKLDADGSFIIKNLGKRSIFLNGKEIATGQARGLGASSVIEIESQKVYI